MVGWLLNWSGERLTVAGRMLCKQWSWICYPFVCAQNEGDLHLAQSDDVEVKRRVWELMFLLLEERNRLHDLLTEIGDSIISTK